MAGSQAMCASLPAATSRDGLCCNMCAVLPPSTDPLPPLSLLSPTPFFLLFSFHFVCLFVWITQRPDEMALSLL